MGHFERGATVSCSSSEDRSDSLASVILGIVERLDVAVSLAEETAAVAP
jgi:hypothetical protein